MSVLTPVRTSQVLPLQASKLSSMSTLLGGSGRVLVAKGNRITDPFPDVDANGYASRIILMSRNDTPREYLDMTIPLYFNVKFEVKPALGDVNIICDNIHAEIYTLLQDTTITMTSNDQLFKTWRKWVSTQVRYDEAVGCYYNTAVYQTILTPKQD